MSQDLNVTERNGVASRDGATARLITVSVILPAYDEAATIATIIDQVIGLTIPGVQIQLIIVESNSNDGTREVVTRYSEHPSVTIVLQDSPKGKGNAVREGLRHATGDIILIQDGDLEYRVDEYPIVLNPILKGESDFVLGCRHLKGKPIRDFPDGPPVDRIINLAHWLLTGLFDLLYWVPLRDPMTMFKVFRRQCIEDVPFVANRFDFDLELVGKLVRLGYKPLEVPISYKSRGFAEGKKVHFFRDPPRVIAAILRFRFSRLKLKAGEEASVSSTGLAEHRAGSIRLDETDICSIERQ